MDSSKLDRLAEIAVRVGLNLQPGQQLVVTAPVEALPLVRRVAHHAYRAGGSLVTPVLSDADVTLSRFREGAGEGFDAAPTWLHAGIAHAVDGGAARLVIQGDDPALLGGQDPDRVSRANRALALAQQPVRAGVAGLVANWATVAYPGTAWAARVFPTLDPDVAVERLAEAVFAASRVDGPDPVSAWRDHQARLLDRRSWLDRRRFAALHFSGPGTDLTVGLADGHAWRGGLATAKNGVACNPNIPTEEVFACPHALRVEGTARATKPLSHGGTLIEDIEVRFEAGRVVEARARRGEEVLRRLLDTDEGARRLGEVALVPHSSPISRAGLLFYNTLLDENAASHVALGRCLAMTLENGLDLSSAEMAARGGNLSAVHVDWMVGSGQVDVDGIDRDGARSPVMRAGEWT